MRNDNDFHKKYQPIDWQSDGMIIFNKIGNNLTSRFETISFDIDKEGLGLNITQNDIHCSFFWIFNDSDFSAYLVDKDSNIIKNMGDIEGELERCGIVKESKNNNSDMKNMKTFENWKNDKAESEMRNSGEEIMNNAQEEAKHSEKCACGKNAKEDCECGPECDCEKCKEKYSK